MYGDRAHKGREVVVARHTRILDLTLTRRQAGGWGT
jgi:hypothetical protein